ncbi:MAG: ligase-associated DNA damage response endonuclease PdeM [Gemmatimonadales bacterium]|nr:MAG: ligase-associated DNA damage response endonuclease PdeM [Gemmatimonadales bacterium]
MRGQGEGPGGGAAGDGGLEDGSPGALPLTWWEEDFLLLGDGALLRCTGNTLLVADLHLGKEAVFRSRGLPIPEGAGTETLDRLARTCLDRHVREVVILGDLVHGPEAWTPETIDALLRWRARIPGEVWWILGNHDRTAGPPPCPLGIREVEDEAYRGRFLLRHEPPAGDGPESPQPVICGHLHPVIRLRAPGIRARPACFVVDPQVMILPAYGIFTGGYAVERRSRRRLFAAAGSTVVEVGRGSARSGG